MSARKESQILSAIFWVLVASGVGVYAYMDQKKTENKKVAKEEAKRLFKLDVELPKKKGSKFKLFSKKNKKNKKKEPSREALRKKLIQQGITEVTIHNGNAKAGKQTITMARKGIAWVVTSPVKTPGDLTNIKTILSEIAGAKRTRFVRKLEGKNDAKTLKRYGLATPKHSISFRFRKLTHTVLIGNKDKYTNDYYAHVKGSKEVVLVGSSLYYAADKKLYALRRKEMFTQNTNNISILAIKRRTGDLVFKRHGATVHHHKGHHHHGHGHGHGHKHQKRSKTITKEWRMAMPKQAKTNPTKVNGLLSTLKGMRAEAFASEDVTKDAKKFGLDKPIVTVTVTFKNKKSLTLRLSAVTDKKKKTKFYAAAAKGPIARISKHIPKALQGKAFNFRQQRLMRFRYNQAKVLQIAAGGTTFQLMRIDGKSESWRVLAPSPRKGDKSKVTNFINNLRDLKTLRFVKESLNPQDMATYGLDKPALNVRVYGATAKKVVAGLLVGKKNKAGNYFATNHEKTKLFEINAKSYNNLGKASWQFIPKGKPPKRPAPRLSTPAKRPAAPTKRPAAPVKKPTAPAKRAAAPTKPHGHGHGHGHNHGHNHAHGHKHAHKPAKRPAAPAKRPAAPVKKPAAPVKKPAAPAKRPAAPAKRPAAPAKRPAAPAKKPAAPVKKPAAPAKKPAAPAKRPAAPAKRPAAPAKRPADRR